MQQRRRLATEGAPIGTDETPRLESYLCLSVPHPWLHFHSPAIAGCGLSVGSSARSTIKLTTSVGHTSTHSPSMSHLLMWRRSIRALPSCILSTPLSQWATQTS